MEASEAGLLPSEAGLLPSEAGLPPSEAGLPPSEGSQRKQDALKHTDVADKFFLD